MTNSLKPILLKIARLPRSDQRWIISKLSSFEAQRLRQAGGEKLLQEAQRFRKLNDEIQPLTCGKIHSPSFHRRLAKYSPLFVAIVLEQGNYSWQEQFLTEFDEDGSIRHLLTTQVQALKPSARQTLFKQWKATLSFDDHLETIDG